MTTTSEQRIAELEAIVAAQHERLVGKERVIERLETLVAKLQQQRFGASSERHPGQGELHLFDEAEIVADAETSDDEDAATAGSTTVAPHTRRRPKPRPLPDHLERVEIRHELEPEELACTACGDTLSPIGEDVTEQLGIVPQKLYVIRRVRVKYACRCKDCMRSAPAPAAPLPGSRASPVLLSHTMVGKYHDGLPLYRQERMHARAGVTLPRSTLARWLLRCEGVLQPIYNLIEDAFFAYDIALSDDTTIQVLKEDGRAPSSKSALWIRRGGPPDSPVVLVDYRVSKSAATASGLLAGFCGYLVSDAAPNFHRAVAENALVPVLCNDHARRRFAEIVKTLPRKEKTKGWTAMKAIGFYRQLYAIERELGEANATPEARLARRRAEAVPLWEAFIGWAREVADGGVRHAPSAKALKYLLENETGLRRYCEDGRLPISNILSEHVAKTIALARKNFLFADTPAGASASAMIYSVLETARANGQDVYRYMAVLLEALPNAQTVEEIEALLPWRLTDEALRERFARLPAP